MTPPARAAQSKSTPTRPVLSATRARQGLLRRPVFWVLVASTFLAALGLALAWAWKAPDLSAANSNNGKPGAGPAFNAPPPAAPKETENPRP